MKAQRIVELVAAIMRREKKLQRETIADLGYIKLYAESIKMEGTT